ncbi:glycosyltransferase [uncultured Bacteroides sp.]|uniref:glycosyltransferase n=1 Tax=uncultured Bacteroides sp. TaxID=162156 RepID=UPI0025FA00AD|nr:glycosyltransferase [uncultured Bacteroides sp.]
MEEKDTEALMVTVRCTAYNHESYIQQCLEGFVMQKTNFRFEVIVHDDASTDGTVTIIRKYAEKYPNIIKPIFETENQYSKRDGSLARIMDEHTHGKYVAFCEGDDYWVDPLKLQKQVDFLETHPEYGMVHTNFQYYINRDNAFVDNFQYSPKDKLDIILSIIDGNKYRVQTNTVLFRNELYKIIITSDDLLYKSSYFFMGDTQLWIGILLQSNIYYLNSITAIYRVAEGSACRNSNLINRFRFDLSSSELRLYLLDKVKKKYPSLDSNVRLKRKLQKEYNLNLIRYKLFVPSFKPLYSLSMQYNLLYSILRFPFLISMVKKYIRLKH